MAGRGEELNTRLTATDDASRVVDQVARKLDEIEDEEYEARLTADDQASPEIRDVDQLLDRLTAEERRFVLEAEARAAQRDVDQLLRKLSRVDDYDGDEVKLILDAKDEASKKLDGIKDKLAELEDEADDVGKGIGDKLRDRFDGLSNSFTGIGGKMAGKLAAGFAAVGVGALMAESLAKSWENAAGHRRITAQFALTEAEAAEAGRVAGKLYADNWGDSMPEVQQVVARSMRQLRTVTEDELAAVSSQVIAFGNTWEQDYDAVIRSISQMLENGLAGSAQEALDIVAAAFQQGGDEAGDLLDTIDEYSQHFANMGFDGEEALGIIVHGLQNGQRDADKMADAIKEMMIRATDDSESTRQAFEDLGFDADEMGGKFRAGGDDARQAFEDVIGALQDVEDPIEQNKLGVALLGTQFEDLGPRALESLGQIEAGLGDVEGTMDRVTEKVGEVSPWQEMQREGETALGSIGNLLVGQFGIDDGLGAVNESLGWASSGFGLFGDSAEDAGDQVSVADEKLSDFQDTLEDLRQQGVEAYIEKAEYAADANEELAEVTDLATAAAERQAAAVEQAAEAERKRAEELRKIRNRFDEAEAALRRYQDELDARKAVLSLSDQRQRVDELKAAWQQAVDEFGAESAEAQEAARRWEGSVIDLKDQVIEYGTQIGNIPEAAVTKLIADIDRGKVAEVEAFLARWGNGVNVPIRPQMVTTSFGTRIYVDEFGNVRNRHTGGRVGPGDIIQPLSGEAFVPDTGGRVMSREDVAAAGATPGLAVYAPITLNVSGEVIDDRTFEKLMTKAGPSAARMISDQLERWYRNGGRAPRSA